MGSKLPWFITREKNAVTGRGVLMRQLIRTMLEEALDNLI